MRTLLMATVAVAGLTQMPDGLESTLRSIATGPAVDRRVAYVSLRLPTDRDRLYFLVAVRFRVPALCRRIDKLADGGGSSLAPRGFQVHTFRSACFVALARKMHDPSLCSEVLPVIEGLFADGGRFSKEYCLQGKTMDDSDSIYPLEPFIALMRRLGYGDREVVEAEYQEDDEDSPTYAAYERLRDDPAFIARVESAQGFPEPRNETAMRPAHALEFLFEMIAVDFADPTLCSRVSPNAALTDRSGRTALLQSRCYLYIAGNSGNSEVCQQLPPSRSFPFVNGEYDTAQRCAEMVALESRAIVRSGLRRHPVPFAHAADFQVAMRQLGFPPAFVDTRVAPPAPKVYWGFIDRLRDHAPAADRDEFVRRVMSLE